MKTKIRFATKASLSVLLILLLLFGSTSGAWAAGSVLPEVRSLLQDAYVDPVTADVLNAPTIEETLQRLGDPHTVYFSQQEYQDFVNSLDQSFSGLGIHIDIVPEGVLVVSVIKGSPAEKVDLKAGDIIIEAAGQSLAGISSLEQAVSILRGPDGSRIQIKVKRQDSVLDFTVTRGQIEEPTVTGELADNHTGYLRISSFGRDTAQIFRSLVDNLRQRGVDSWIIDLRDNPGGYLDTAIDLAGYFIGHKVAVQVKDRRDRMASYQAPDHGFVLNDPVIFLVNENSASASEILTAAVKDDRKAVVIGAKTYGKGTVQSMFGLSDGSVLKMTVARFYSPNGNSNDRVGINPDLPVAGYDAKAAAELLLSKRPSLATATDPDYAMVMERGYNYALPFAKARTPEYWTAWGAVLDDVAAGTGAVLLQGGTAGWQEVPAQALKERWPLYYPGYRQIGTLDGIPVDKKFTVHFNGTINWQSVDANSVELVDAVTGERVKLDFNQLGSSDLQVVPKEALQPGTTYWLVVNPAVRDGQGNSLSNGTLTIAATAGPKEPDASKAKIQAAGQSRAQLPADYGMAILW